MIGANSVIVAQLEFDFMSVKPHDVAPLLRAKVQTEMRLWSRTALFTTPTLWKQELFYSKVSFQFAP